MIIYIFVFLFLFLFIIYNLYKIYSLNSKIIKTNIISINKNRIIFIIPNIYELDNYEVNKYKSFINYLIANNYECVVLTSLINNINNIIIKNYNGIIYNTLKYPILTEKQITNEILNGDEIFIVNKELLWIYNSLINIKKKYNNIKIFISCEKDDYNFTELKSINMKYLQILLKNNIFNGVLINQSLFDGDTYNLNTVNNFKNYTKNIYDTQFINLSLFKKYKIDNYDNKEYNIIFTGNANEIIYILSLFYSTDNLLDNNFNFHILTNLEKSNEILLKIKELYPTLYDKIKMYGKQHHLTTNSKLFDLFMKLNNRIYILIKEYDFAFIKAGMTGIPIFIKETNKNKDYPGIIFNDKKTFINEFNNFNKLFTTDKLNLIMNKINKIKNYDKNLIFDNWLTFIKTKHSDPINYSSLSNKDNLLLYIFLIKYFVYRSIVTPIFQ